MNEKTTMTKDEALAQHDSVQAKPEPEQAPVAKVVDWGIEGPRLQGLTDDWPRVGTLLYTTPPQRKPLTRKRLLEIADAQCGAQRTFEDWVELFGRCIEAAHGIGVEE